ncbi:SH3 domain-containing protein [Staphylococcus xylosus]|uniref:SH3 domain-containing protein n=1 Tax=Staphylococcus xylosus TaxID=1288 RepID=UPI003F988233
MVAKLTQKEFLAFLKSTEGKQYDEDGYAAFQCFDYANTGWLKLYGYKLKGEGAADIPNKNDFNGKATVYQNTETFLAKPGDLVVFNRTFGGGYGHVAWVIEATLDYIIVLEQNWLGGGWTSGDIWNGTGWETVTKRKHSYSFPMWFIRPHFKSESAKTISTQSATKSTTTKKAPAKKKASITVSTQRINYTMNKRGYKPKAIVIHNDAGSSTGKQYENALVNADYNRLANGIAHAYATDGYVWEAISEDRVAWHTANNNGNTNAYGIEVCQSMSASDKEFLKHEQTVFQFVADKLTKWGIKANRNTVRLHDEYVPTSCPHRSYKLHTGFDPVRQGRPNEATRLKLKDYFIKQIRAYQDGKIPTATVVKGTSASSNTKSTVAGAWRKNSYGTWYMSEKARFTNGSQPIMVRTVGPFRSCPYAYDFQPGGYCDYDEVLLQDGHVWIGYDWQGKRYYLPIRTWNGANPPNHSVGELWGIIS